MTDILFPGMSELAPAIPAPPAPRSDEAIQIVGVLEGYRKEAEEARKGGPNGRDAKWEENVDLYWNRHDFSGKADWQAKEVLPEVPVFIDRFAAAMKDAWTASTASEAYTVVDPADANNDLSPALKSIEDVWLSRAGRNQSGHPLGFESIIEEQTKLGALMSCSSIVGWREDVGDGRVAIETVDPRSVWIDHTYRNLYRIREVELDKHEILALRHEKDGRGKPLYNLEELEHYVANLFEEGERQMEQLRGTGEQITSSREPVKLHEYYGTIVLPNGEVVAKNALAVVANGTHLIRGPEKNPFWHGRDWLTFAPLITVPLSVYGRTYCEDFGSVARTFNNLTNLILDAVYTSSLKVFAIVPEMLRNPEQANTGLVPGKTFQLELGLGGASDFMSAVDLGTLSSDAVNVWQTLKNELREAAGMNEVGLGQFAPNSRTSATEISETQQSSSAMVRSIAQTLEQRYVSPTLDLVWKTGVQHMKPDDKALQQAAGPEMYSSLISIRKELVRSPITFQARGISTLIAKGQKLRALLQLLQVVASNPLLLQQFTQVVDMEKLVNLLFDLSNIDIRRISKTEREMQMAALGPMMQPGGEGSAGAADVASMMGIGR